MDDAITRRTLLRAGAAAAGAAASLGACRPREPARAPGEWTNWSGSQVSRPAQFLFPRDETALVESVRSTVGRMRVVGAGHSFTALCKTDETLVSLDHLAGLAAWDGDRRRATVRAGTRLHDLGRPLREIGQALPNQGDVDVQSLGGACGTSTHGTGITLGSFSSMVRGVRLVTGEGDVVEASPERDADVFHAACTSLGAAGILTEVTLQNRAPYKLRERETVEPLRDVLDGLGERIAAHRHFEFWCFFENDDAIVKTLDETGEEPTPPPGFELPVDVVVETASRVAHAAPVLDGVMQGLLTALHVDSNRVGWAYEIFPSPRNVRFNEMEYEVPVERGPECLLEILAAVRKKGLNTLFPIEYRTVAGDDAWLSPFYERPSAAISVHRYFQVDYRPLFAVVEPVFRKYGGRPHWGKLHRLTARELRDLYPRWDDFRAVRRRLDPKGRFLNAHLRTVLGEDA